MDPKLLKLQPMNGASPEDVIEALAGITGVKRAKIVKNDVVVESSGHPVPQNEK